MLTPVDPFDLISPKSYGSSGSPHDVWARLRREAPVHRCELGGSFENFWAITRHADIMLAERVLGLPRE